jgi:hypothetical protein
MIKIYVRPSELVELFNFLSTSIKYEHTVKYWIYGAELLSFPVAEVLLGYEDYVTLEDWKMENRTTDSTDL